MQLQNRELITVLTQTAHQTVTNIHYKGEEHPLTPLMKDDKGAELRIMLSRIGKNWFIDFLTAKRVILKNSGIALILEDASVINLNISSGAIKFTDHWRSIAILNAQQFEDLKDKLISRLILTMPNLQEKFVFKFVDTDSSHLLKKACQLLSETEVLLPNYTRKNKRADAQAQSLPKINASVQTGGITNRHYNLNTQYGRRMARKQALDNYNNGSDAYRNDIDQMKLVFWAIVIFLFVIVFIIVYMTAGSDSALKMLR